ncbi:MAG: ABC transporter permease subunit, partial [Halobacteriales archaeon]|nr:ABC transporter permease subunit [Halobacteriales archaeon]
GALIPLLIVWVGSGHESRIILAVIGSILPILLSTYNGARETSRNLIWAARSMGVSDFKTLRHVVFPFALPEIMTGVRIGIIFSFVIVVASEMIIAQTGLGLLVTRYGQFGQYERVFGTILWIAIVVTGIDRLYLRFSSHVLRWSEQEVGGV